MGAGQPARARRVGVGAPVEMLVVNLFPPVGIALVGHPTSKTQSKHFDKEIYTVALPSAKKLSKLTLAASSVSASLAASWLN